MNDSPTGELRSFEPETGLFEAVALTYGTIDSHGTRWLPGVFAESLRAKLPTVHLGHVEGQARHVADIVDFRDTAQRLEVVGQLRPATVSDFARRAWQGLRSRVLTDVSVVFTRQKVQQGPDGVPEFVKALLHRVDLVLDGSVPGAKLLSFRNASELGPVAARMAAAERAAGAGDLWTPRGSASGALREADEALNALDG